MTKLPSILNEFDRMFATMNDRVLNQGFPPYNIVKVDENHYKVELAVAGLTIDELKISLESDNLLVIQSGKSEEETKNVYIHKGISSRSFIRKFTLQDSIEVGEANLENGILSIELIRVVPEVEKTRMIPINKKAEKTLLTE